VRSLLDNLLPFRRTALITSGLLTATAITSATGFVFWWEAAHLFDRQAVGLAGAAVSAMIILSQLAELGLGTKIVGVLHLDDEPRSLAATALVVTTVAGAVIGLVFVFVAPALFDELDPLRSNLVAVVVFIAGVSLSTAGSVLDQHLVAMSRDRIRLLRNVVFAVTRLPLLPVAAALYPLSGSAIYAVWVGALVLSFGVFRLEPRSPRERAASSWAWARLGRMAGDSLSHHVVNLSRSSATWLLPLLVTVIVSQSANASFYVALLIANFIALVGSSATFTLYVVGAQSQDALGHQIRFTFIVSLLAAALGTLFLWLFGAALFATFGDAYAAEAYPAAVILAASTLPLTVKDHWISVQRVRGRVRSAAAVASASLVFELACATIGAVVAGVAGLAIARLGSLLIEAAILLPGVAQAARIPGSMTPGAAVRAGAGDAERR
jgi:O-antigen/teichoic acid export membrane protein